MAFRNLTIAFLLAFTATSLIVTMPHPAAAQIGGGGIGGGGGGVGGGGIGGGGVGGGGQGGQGGNGQGSTIGTGSTSGVLIDAEGVLHRQALSDPSGQLRKHRQAQARAQLGRELTKPSKLRKISLNRLESALADRLANQQGPTDVMRYLAGLSRLQYVFFYPETGDIVLAGPAEGWFDDWTGRVLGIRSGRPVLELQDLIVALRAYPPSGRRAGQVSCSIDPTPEGLVRLQKFLQQIGRHTTPGDTPAIVAGMRRSLGRQEITISGISPNTHFAEVMVEADYRMKLIGIGLEIPPIPLRSYVALAKPSTVSRNAMQRWYFVPDYECVRVSDDELAMELIGDGVKLVGADEVVAQDGSRGVADRQSKASQMFVKAFTRRYPQLAAQSPVYAQLRNLIDLLVATAFIQEQDYYGQSGWMMDVFGSEQTYPVENRNAPKTVATAVNSVWKGSRVMLPIGGGVSIHAEEALIGNNLLVDEDGQVDQARQQIDIQSLPKDQWWWD